MPVSNVKTVNILGVTGSIGQSARHVIKAHRDHFQTHVVSAHKNVTLLAQSAKDLNARHAVIADENLYANLKDALSGTDIQAHAGARSLLDFAGQSADITLAAIMGMAGLAPLMKAIEGSNSVAIANKEPLVSAGPLIKELAEGHKTKLLPVDSEHNAIFQVFEAAQRDAIEKLILTASGGPFRDWSLEQMKAVQPEQALKHPNWEMGQKISIDSATMVNKALEVIEAHELFDMALEKIDVLIHPQSIVHSMVEYNDGSILAQLGPNDMQTPILNALAWPQRLKTPGTRLDLQTLSRLDFEAPDFDRFPALRIGYDCLSAGLWARIIFNAANEVAVEKFLGHALDFLGIIDCIGYCLDHINDGQVSDLETVLNFDQNARRTANDFISGHITKRTA